MICSADIMNLKTNILEKIGQKIIVKGSLGRNKTFEKEATIDKAYANIFTVKYEGNSRNATYSYTEPRPAPARSLRSRRAERRHK